MRPKAFTVALGVAATALAVAGYFGGDGWPGLASVLLSAWAWIRVLEARKRQP